MEEILPTVTCYILNIINVSVELLLFKLRIQQYEDVVLMSCFLKVLLLYFRHWGYLFAQMHLALLKAEKSNEENKAQLDTFMRCFLRAELLRAEQKC